MVLVSDFFYLKGRSNGCLTGKSTGLGGAQVLRSMDPVTKMHGEYVS